MESRTPSPAGQRTTWGPREPSCFASATPGGAEVTAGHWVRALKAKLHEVKGELVSRLLPEDPPRFHRMLVRKIAEKVPLPPDVKLAAIARGLMVLGIFMCVVQNLRRDRCACCNLWCQAWSPKRSRRALWNCLMR